MLKKKLFRTIGAYKAQFISMIIMITLGVGMFVGFNMEWVSIQYNMNDFFEKTGYADYFLVSEQGFSAKEAGEIGQIEGVRAISRFLSVNADVKEQSGDTVALSVSENAEVSGFMLMSGTPYDANDQKGIWLSDRYAKENGIEIGDTLTFLYGGMTLDGQVRGLIKSGEQMICVRDSTQLMPDFSTHGFAYISPAFYARATGLDYYPQLHVLSNLEKEAFGEKADAVLGRTTLLMEKSETPSYSADANEAQRTAVWGKYKGDRSATVSVKAKEKTVSLDIYDLARNHVRIAGKDGNPIRPLSDEGAYLCLRLSEEFGLSEGDTFEISSYGSDQIYTLRVAGVYRSVSESIAVSASYAESLNLPFAFDSVYTDTPKEEIVADAAIKTVQSKQMIMDSFETFTDLMDTMIYLLVFGALLLGVIVLYNLGVMSYTERYREMATLKVVGFPDRKIGRLLVEQNLWLSVLGVLCGIPLGEAVLSVLLKALAGEYEMKMKLTFGTCLIANLLTVAMSLSVSFFISCKNRKIDMVEALKGVD